jgi:carboxymethylenebutenolidase
MSSTKLVTSDSHTLGGYCAGPTDATKGIVVVQEIFGVNKHIRTMADAFAGAGYKVIAPALFDRAEKDVQLGYGADDRKAGVALMGKLTPEMSLADMVAAAQSLGVSSVGVVGFCFGGTMAFLGATRAHAFKAASCWYGGGIAKAKDEKPQCPVQMHFGEADGSIPSTDIAAIKMAQPSAEVHTYPGAGHGFGCADRDSFNKNAYELALARTIDFFSKTL